MLYTRIRPLRVYKQSELLLPRGEKIGFGNSIFMLNNSQESTMTILNRDFINYKKSYYKHYYIDAIYRDKLGKKRVYENYKKKVKDTVDEASLSGLKFISYNNKKTAFNRLHNMLVDMGEWNKLFFTNVPRTSPEKYCKTYIDLITSKMNDVLLEKYKKFIYIDINSWTGSNIIKISSKNLNNPLSILLYSAYKNPSLLESLDGIDIIITNSAQEEFMILTTEYLNSRELGKIKGKIKTFMGLDDSGMDEVVEDTEEPAKSPVQRQGTIFNRPNQVVDSPTSTPTPVSRVSEPTKIQPSQIPNNAPSNIEKVLNNVDKEKEDLLESRKKAIVNTIKKNLVGDGVDDITEEIDSDDDSKDDLSLMDDDLDQEIEAKTLNYLDENDDELEVLSDDEVVEKIESKIKRDVYISKIVPEKTEKEKQIMEKLSNMQKEVIGLPSFEDLQSKIIPETTFEDLITTSNDAITKSKFVNFTRSYNEKKLESDIDNAVGILSKADYPLYIIDKQDEDTSDQLNLKRTLTYTLEDLNGKKHKVKFDVPIIIEDSFIYLNGSKKVIQNQFILKPLVKTNPNRVWIVTNYNKIAIERRGDTDKIASALKKFILKNPNEYNVKFGNSIVVNRPYKTNLEYDILCKGIYSFDIDGNRFIFNIHDLYKFYDSKDIKYDKKNNNRIYIGYNKKTKEPLFIKDTDDIIEYILRFIPNEDQEKIKKEKVGRLMFLQATIMKRDFPIILFMLFCEGFTKIMQRANVEYHFVPKDGIIDDKLKDSFEYESIKLADGQIFWKRYPLQNSLLLNGMQRINTEEYTFAELESKDTYINLLTKFFPSSNISYILDQFKDFMIDDIALEILKDFNLPTNLMDLIIYSSSLLVDNEYIPEMDLRSMRVRSNEIIAFHVYNKVTDAYNNFRRSQHKKNPTKVSINPDSVMIELKKSKLVEEVSVLNPVLELEKGRSVTPKGERGINLENSFTLDKRAYSESMLGVVGISTSPKRIGTFHGNMKKQIILNCGDKPVRS